MSEIHNNNIFAEADVLFLIIWNVFDVSLTFAEILKK